MGQLEGRIKLPRHVQGMIDRHGHARFYFRRNGFPRATLPGIPWTPEFMAAYQAAMAGVPDQLKPLGVSRSTPGSVAAAIAGYYTSAAWTQLQPNSRRMRRPILEKFREQYGDKRLGKLERKHMQAILNRLTPNMQRNYKMSLRGLMAFAIKAELIEEDPTIGLTKDKAEKGEGHVTWTEAIIERYRLRHPIGTQARLAMEIMLNTGLRRSDAMRIGPSDIKDGWLHDFCPKKTSHTTGIRINVPIRAELAAAIAATTLTGTRTFLVNSKGQSHASEDAFGKWMRDRCDEAGLADCSSHGLRKACLTRLANAGIGTRDIMAISGHVNEAEVQTYVDAYNRRQAAARAFAVLDDAKG